MYYLCIVSNLKSVTFSKVTNWLLLGAYELSYSEELAHMGYKVQRWEGLKSVRTPLLLSTFLSVGFAM